MTTSTILTTLGATIAHYTHLFLHNDVIFEDDLEANVCASNWLQKPPHCPMHSNEPMFQLLVETPGHKKGDWICHSCNDLERFARIESEQAAIPIINDSNYHGGDVRRAINKAQEAYKQELINRIAMERVSTLPRHTGEIKMLIPQANVPTAPLPAQDIVYESTPDLDKTIPRLRAVTVTISRSTKQIPAINAEVLLESIKNARVSPHETGEQEKLPAMIEDGAFLL